MTRREATKIMAGTTASLLMGSTVSAQQKPSILLRAIPSSGEKLPAIGLGTYRAFDVGSAASERAPLEEVLQQFVKQGGKLVDSSPMYGNAEDVVGALADKLGLRDSLFLATKVWTTGNEAGVQQMERSAKLMRAQKLDLIQVHNLVDLDTHLRTLRDWKQSGRVRYLGITHYTDGSHPEVARVLEKEAMDFVQINYSLMEREADDRVFPVAKERGVAVIVNRPFGSGNLFSRVRGKALPDYAKEIDCTTWAQFFLKWIISNPTVTCAIPATRKPKHLVDNMQAGSGRLPDPAMRQRMVETIAAL